jgi:hypothetical protein
MSSYDDRGWVAPVPGEGDGHMDPIEPTQRTIRSSVIGGIILVAVIAAAVTGTILWRSRNGDPFASAHSVPANMDFVVTFDALALSDSQELQSFVDAFAVPMVNAGMIEDYPDDLVGAVDEALATDTNFTLSDDILPWIGRSVSLAASVPQLDPGTFGITDVSLLLSADVRNHDAAEVFVTKVLSEMAQNDLETTATTIGGLPGYAWQDASAGISFGLVLTDDSLLIGVERDVADAIAANDAGLSIADDATFTDVMSHLPDNRMVSFYMSKGALDGILDLATMSSFGMGQTVPQENLFNGMGASVSLVDEGMLFSYAVAGEQQAQTVIAPDRDVVAALPDDTLAFFSVAGSGTGTGTVDEQMLGSFGDLFDQVYNETGVDVQALLGSLSGDITVAATETRDGSLAAQSEVPVGVVGALGLTDTGPITDLLATLEGSMAPPSVDFEKDGGVTTVSENGQELVSYSIGSDVFVIGTGRQLVSDVVAGGDGGPRNSDLYRKLDGLLVGDGLVGYADIPAIVDLIPMTSEEAAVVAPVRGVGIGGKSDGNVQQMEMLVLVDY